MTIRRAPVNLQSPSQNPFRLARIPFQIEEIAQSKLCRGVLSLAKVDRRLERFSRLLLAAQMNIRYSQLREGFVIVGKCFDGLCEVTYTPSGVVLAQAHHPLLIFFPRFVRDLQFADGDRVFLLARFRPFHRRQVKHQLQGRPLKLCLRLHRIVAGFFHVDLVTARGKSGHFEVPVIVRQNAMKYARSMRFQSLAHLAQRSIVALRKYCPGNRSGRRRGFGALRSCVRDGACQYEVQEEDRQEFRSLQSLLGFPRFVQHLDLPPTLEAFPRWTLRLGEIIRPDADRHILQSFDGCGCGFASAAGAPFPLVANRRAPCNLLLRETSLSVLFCTLHNSCQEFLSFLRAVNACKQTKIILLPPSPLSESVSTRDTLPHPGSH